MPDLRTVLLKYFDDHGFVFYTNYGSRKAKEMEENPQAALLFPWIGLNRQVRIQGAVEKVSKAESLRYFASRPRGSQIGAWASAQSRALPDRFALEAAIAREALGRDLATVSSSGNVIGGTGSATVRRL